VRLVEDLAELVRAARCAETLDAVAAALEARGWHFHAFIGDDGYRLMCSWDTRDEDLQALVQDLREVLSASS
jgi:threonine aldolase